MAENVDPKGSPIQILTFDFDAKRERNSTLVLHEDNLAQILKLCGDRQVAIISIVGPSRQGKSFLLDFLLRYLESLETDETDWFGYDNPEKALNGFKWRLGIEPETSGMWMWSQPFVVKLGDGKECCILLMDTQGTYDEYTTQREWSSIVGLSLLTSSTLIFNFMSNLQEDTLLSLDTFMEYGLLAAGGANTDKPAFQNLTFLIRDWNVPAEFPYGAKGGMSFLNRKLEIKADHGEDAKRIRNSIRKCFEELHCFLMPDPGDKIKQPDYNGSIQGLSPKFAKNLECFVSDLLNTDVLKVKLIDGVPVKASGLSVFFQKYVEVFNLEEAIQPLSLHQATAIVINMNAQSDAIDVYRKAMQLELRKQVFLSETSMSKCHAKASEKATKHFESAKKSGSQAVIDDYNEKLADEIEKEFHDFKIQNAAKKAKIIQKSHDAATQNYLLKVKEEMEESFMDPKELSVLSESIKLDVISAFFDECSNEDPELLQEHILNLKTSLSHQENALNSENEKLILQAEKANMEVVQQAAELYLTTIKGSTDKDFPLSNEQLDTVHAESSNTALQLYATSKLEGNANFRRKFEHDLKTQIEITKELLQKENDQKRKLFELKMLEFLSNTIKKYETQMAIIAENLDSEEALEEEYAVCTFEIFASFDSTMEFPNEMLVSHRPKLETSLTESFVQVKHNFIQSNRNLDSECEKALYDSLASYSASMATFLNSKEFHRTEDFESEHDEERQKAIDQAFVDLQQIGCQEDKEEEYLKKLKVDLDVCFSKLTEQNTLKQELAAAKVQNDVTDYQRSYHEQMMKQMETCRNEASLQALHETTKDSVVSEFKSKYHNVHASFIDPHVCTLEAEILKTFQDVSELFQLKREESEAGTKSALNDAQKFYQEEFAKYFSDRDFRSPKDLDDIHKAVTKITVERCNKKAQLSPLQKEDLSIAMEKVYEKYKDLNNMNMPTNPAIGIDLGTTFCCVGVYAKGKVTIIENDGNKTTPSYVGFTDAGEVVGEAAKNQNHENPENTIYDAKRIIGRKMDDAKLQKDMKLWPFTVVEESGVPKILARGKTYHPEQISAKLLSKLKTSAEDYLGCSVTNAVITVPAYFNDGQRQATIDAGELAGLKVLKIINEPTAAAIAYRLQHVDLEARNVLIFDLGGGTFDVAVLRISDGKIDVKAVDGDTHLGGEDFDNNIVEFVVLEFQAQHGINLMEGRDSSIITEKHQAFRLLRRLKSQCEDQKIDLSSMKKVNISVDAIKDGIDLNVGLTREKFEQINGSIFAKTIEIVERALDSAAINKGQIHDIVLVGGSTRIPKVQQLLSEFFGGKALNKTINPDEAVAFGAAIQAAILNGEIAKESIDFTKIQDVSPMSLGVEVYGGGFSKIIKKNTNIPVKIQEIYRTAHNNQTSVQIIVYQGEDTTAANNDKLGEFYLKGIPPGDAGVENIEVEMEINEQGILHVTAICVSTGKVNDLAITEYKQRLSRNQIQKILDQNSSSPGA